MKVIVTKDYEEMSDAAFEIMSKTVSENPRAVLGLATGSTPLGLYSRMVADHEKNGTSYKEIKTVNLDEYIGFDSDNKESYAYFMRKNLFDFIDIKNEYRGRHGKGFRCGMRKIQCASFCVAPGYSGARSGV